MFSSSRELQPTYACFRVMCLNVGSYACVACLRNGRASVRPSVCLSHHSTAAAHEASLLQIRAYFNCVTARADVPYVVLAFVPVCSFFCVLSLTQLKLRGLFNSLATCGLPGHIKILCCVNKISSCRGSAADAAGGIPSPDLRLLSSSSRNLLYYAH